MKHDADYWKGFWTGRAIAVRLTELAKQPIEVSGIVLDEPESEDENHE